MRPERPECQCLACAQLQHHQANDTLLLVAIAVVVAVGGLVWLVGQVAGLLASGTWPEVRLSQLPGILARLRDHAGDPAAAWPAGVRDRLPGPVGMYATLLSILAIPVVLGLLAWWLHQPPAPPRPPATRAAPAASRPRPPRAACTALGRSARDADAAAAARPSGGAMTATTLRAQWTGLPGRQRSGGDAQGRAATNPVAALPCAPTPLPAPLSIPLLHPLLTPSTATVGVCSLAIAPFRLVRGSDPGRGLWGSWRCGGPPEQGGTLARSLLVDPPPTPWGASRRATALTLTTRGGGMASRQRPRWGTGPAPTHRDVAALAWIAEQYAVRADLLGLLLGRLSPETPKTMHRWEYAAGQSADLPALAEGTVRYHLRRWLRAGWVTVQRALGRTWIVPTPKGLALAGADHRPWGLVPSRLAHVHAVALVRLAIEAANPQAEWVSERELVRLRARQRAGWWLPDGGLVVAEVAVNGAYPPVHTIEVELTPKHLAKLGQVFEARYPGEVQTTYFTPPAHQEGLRRRLGVLEQATRARNEPWSRVTVVPLPELPGVTYEGAP